MDTLNEKREIFFTQLLNLSNQKTALFQNISPQGYQPFLNAGAGKTGLRWEYNIESNRGVVRLSFKSPSEELNKRRFDHLFYYKSKIEIQFGEQLDWDYKEDRQQQYIKTFINSGGIKDEEKWSIIQNEMVNKLIALSYAIQPYWEDL